MAFLKTSLLAVLLGALNVDGYFLQGVGSVGIITKDPIVDPGMMYSNHTHMVAGSSAFDSTITTAKLRAAGTCTTVPISQDHSNYWVPNAWFQWKNGSLSSLTGSFVIYYLFDENSPVTAFPDDFRMITGTPTLRDYDPTSFAQRAVTQMCLDFNGVSKTYTHFPSNTTCPSGIRSQINFPSCWDGKNLDSHDHKSHVAFPSGGPDSGTCNDPNYPITIPRIFMEVYWDTSPFNDIFDQALCPEQPFLTAQGDRTGYGWHADFYNGWEDGVLQNVLDKCDCTIAAFGDPTCCGAMNVVDYRTNVPQCSLSNPSTIPVTGFLPELPQGNIPTGLIAVNDGDIFVNGTWDLAMPLSQQPAPVVLPGTGNAVVAPAASASSSVKATSSAISSAKATTIASSAKVVSTASAVMTPIVSAVPSSSIVHAPSSVPVSKPATSSVSATSNSIAKTSPTPISVGSSSGSGSGSSSGGNGNSDTWTTGGSSSGSNPVDSSSSSAAASSASASSSSSNASSGSSTIGGSQSSSNSAGSGSASNGNSGSAANNSQAPAQNAPKASSSGSSTVIQSAAQASASAATSGSSSKSGLTQVVEASATSSPCPPQETSWTSASSGGSEGVSSSGSSSQGSVNTSSGSSSGNSGNNSAGSSSSSSQNANSGVVNTSSGSSSSNSDGNEVSSSESSSSSNSGSNGGASSSSSSSSSESSNSGSTSGSDSSSDSSGSGNNVPAPAQSQPASVSGSSGSAVASNQPVPPPSSATGAASSSTGSSNSSSGTSNNAAKCKNRHASTLEARAAKAAPIKHAVISSHHSRSRAFNRIRNTGDMLV